MTLDSLDLSTAFLPTYSGVPLAQYSGGLLSVDPGATYPHQWVDFMFPALFLDPATTYAFEVDFDVSSMGTNEFNVSSLNAATQDGFDTSAGFSLATGVTPSSGLTVAFQIGPGVEEWNDAHAYGEHFILFDSRDAGTVISAVRWGVESGATDRSNAAGGIDVRGLATTVFRPVLAAPSGRLAARFDKAVPYPVPTMVNGRPT